MSKYPEYERVKNSVSHYQAYIKNISTGEWLKNESDGKVEHTKDEKEMLVFYDDLDAESTIEYLNDTFSDCYVLLIEGDVTKLHNQDDLNEEEDESL